ncbi:nitrous oxide-stimulated promoter family protein [Paenibacillus macerans]|uniref:nitrous oxide-stimulated promoter family protein n=1 Tax=Paenibacillus macerans TaxID=44252 RepID=UPI003D317318
MSKGGTNKPALANGKREEAGPRIRREQRTVALMIRLYCRKRHGDRLRVNRCMPGDGEKADLCAECAELLGYARQRLDRCRFGEGKSTCMACPVHCYAPEPREHIRKVMAFAGPRMLLRHPLLTVLHLLDGRRAAKG